MVSRWLGEGFVGSFVNVFGFDLEVFGFDMRANCSAWDMAGRTGDVCVVCTETI